MVEAMDLGSVPPSKLWGGRSTLNFSGAYAGHCCGLLLNQNLKIYRPRPIYR
jgi:hypothetical protein